MVKQISLDTWSVHRLHDLLDKATKIITQTNVPIVLYREMLEESDDAYEEIICTLNQDHIVEQVIISGGMVVPDIKQQIVFTIDDFPDKLLNKSKDLFAQVVEQLEGQFS